MTSDGARWLDYELAAEVAGDEWRPVPQPITGHADHPHPQRAGCAPQEQERHLARRHEEAALSQRCEGAPSRWQEPPRSQRREGSSSPWRDETPPQWYDRPRAQWDGPSPRQWRDPPDSGDGGFSPHWPGAAEDWFDGPGRPPRLEACRAYGKPGGLAWPDPQVQQDLCQVVPEGVRFPDPRGTWVRLVNGEGPSEDPFRATNSLDCALAVLSTWHGEPVVAAPMQPQYDRLGRPSLRGEAGGVARAERWLGHRFEYMGQGRRAYTTIARRLERGGHGAAAVLISRWPSGGSHAWNAVNAAGEVVWIDAQRGHTSVEPPAGPVTGIFSVIVDRSGRRL